MLQQGWPCAGLFLFLIAAVQERALFIFPSE
jgi:hypothetical protein